MVFFPLNFCVPGEIDKGESSHLIGCFPSFKASDNSDWTMVETWSWDVITGPIPEGRSSQLPPWMGISKKQELEVMRIHVIDFLTLTCEVGMYHLQLSLALALVQPGISLH